MPHGSDDARKKFILTTTGNFYGLKPSSSLDDSPELNNFLDDGNEFVLSVNKHEDELHLSNKVIQIYEEQLQQATSMWKSVFGFIIHKNHNTKPQIMITSSKNYIEERYMSKVLVEMMNMSGH